MRNAAIPVTLIVIGAVGIVWHFGWLPDAESLTALGLAAAGVLILMMDRVTKSSIVVGPTLIAVGVAVWAHDVYRLRWSLLVPALLVLVGVLMLIARRPAIPERRRPMGNGDPPPTGRHD